MKKLSIKAKFTNKPNYKQTRRLNGVKVLHYGAHTVTLRFDKIGRLCDIQPRIDDLLNRYWGHQRNVIPVIIEYLNSIDYGKENSQD